MNPPAVKTHHPSNSSRRSAVALAALLMLLGAYVILFFSGMLDDLVHPDTLRAWILALGVWGPFSVIGLMTLAIVMSPLPSAPIALAAGTAYGHTLGTLYVMLGAELGALLAFLIARYAGRSVVERWFGPIVVERLEGSQGTIMVIVFVSRLMPFVSFDAVSYAAGLTPLTAWRFAVATLGGILPASFLLAHFGAELSTADARSVEVVLLILGLGLVMALIVRLVRQSRSG
jgi:uncharacterized membrane protein YdjX (TVP38/TMEM64 family)